ncbi:prolipoprotein diacylglyceryl transferase [Ideonella azotifigens]|nr:prolipoprotein diacylglyceryl transferase [Ideonella azotifigens]
MAAGATLWRRSVRKTQSDNGSHGLLAPGRFAVLLGLLIGAGLGNKLVFLIERPDIAMRIWQGEPLWPGQSMVGGLLGGWLGVELAKWFSGQTRSTGDAMVTPLLWGLGIGRIGCLLAGLHDDTYGLPTTVPWGLDLGDGRPRHPSAIYEMLFLAAWGGLRRMAAPRWPARAPEGLHFKLFASGYLLWRLLGDALKPVRIAYPGGLSGIQWVCLVGLAISGWALWRTCHSAIGQSDVPPSSEQVQNS